MDKVDIPKPEDKYQRTRFLNNEASKRFRLKRRTENESVNVSRVVLQSVNGILRQREETLIELKKILHQACMNGESREEAYKKLQEQVQKDANIDISNQRLIRESVKLRTVPIINIAECEGLGAIFKRPMKKGPGIMSQVKDDALLELMELMEKNKNIQSPIESPKSPTVALETPKESRPAPVLPLIGRGLSSNKITVPSPTKTRTFLSKREPGSVGMSEKEQYLKTLLSQVNFSVEIIPLREHIPRRILPQFQAEPDVSITLVDAKSQTSVLRPRTPIFSSNIKKTTPVSMARLSPSIFNENISFVGGKRKESGLEIFPQMEEKRWICPANPALPNLTISRIKSEPPGVNMLFPTSTQSEAESHPIPPQVVEVSKDATILWNINVAESKSQDNIKVEPVDTDLTATFIKPKLEPEDCIWS